VEILETPYPTTATPVLLTAAQVLATPATQQVLAAAKVKLVVV
jgi:hypothetical protein